MSDVFISYSRNNGDAVKRIQNSLSRRGIDVWIDNEDIGTGTRWDMQIEEGIRKCSKVLIVLSKSSVESQNVSDEWSYALEKEKHIIPVLLEECEVPMRIASLQRIEFLDDFDSGMEKLATAIKDSSKDVITKPKKTFKLPRPLINFTKYALPLIAFIGASAYVYEKEFSHVELTTLDGMLLADAEHYIQENYLSIGKIIIDYNENTEGTVFKSYPESGETVRRFSKVDLYVVKDKIRLPEVIGLPEALARTSLQKIGIAVNIKQRVSLNKQDYGKVIDSSHTVDDAMNIGEQVDITIGTKGGWVYLDSGKVGQVVELRKGFKMRKENDSSNDKNLVGTLRKGATVEIIKAHNNGWRFVKIVQAI